MSDYIHNILFLDVHNSAPSIMAEALLNHLGSGRFRAFSAGSNPAGRVDPLAIEQLQSARLPIDGLRSKSWEEFATPDSPYLDFVVTICDQARRDDCPVWQGRPITSHWGIEDPVAVTGSKAAKRSAFSQALALHDKRLAKFINLPLGALDSLTLKQALDDIGRQ